MYPIHKSHIKVLGLYSNLSKIFSIVLIGIAVTRSGKRTVVINDMVTVVTDNNI